MNRKEMGRLSRKKGMEFERKVRHILTKQGWIVQKHGNNIDLENDCFIQSKTNRFFVVGGFPDFMGFYKKSNNPKGKLYNLIFVECKTNNLLTKEEKLKMNWLKENNYNCWIAYLEGKEVKFRKWELYKPNKIKNEI